MSCMLSNWCAHFYRHPLQRNDSGWRDLENVLKKRHVFIAFGRNVVERRGCWREYLLNQLKIVLNGVFFNAST